MKERKTLSDFYENDVPSYAAYDNLRKIASFIDGLKLSQRKVVYTMLKRFPDSSAETKTSRLAASVAEETEYLHGESSLCTVLNTMAASYSGSNNFPLVRGSGNFGSRFSGAGSAAAPRYTFCSISDLTARLVPPVVRELCPSQVFEGSEIEPEFYVPVFPVLFLNGTDGISSGWKACIFPRKPSVVLKYLKESIDARSSGHPVSEKARKAVDESLPYFRGFAGTSALVKDPGSGRISYLNQGAVRRVHSTLLEIDEIPISYDYAGYVKTLDRIAEKEDTIVDYEDRCDPKSDTFKFSVKVKREFWTKFPSEEEQLKALGLQKILTEQLNCIGENGRVVEFSSISEILDAYVEKRLEYYGLQKKYLLDDYSSRLETAVSKYEFVSGVVSGSIVIGNRKTSDIEPDLEKNGKIAKKDGSYNYLFGMPMRSMTKETMERLKNDIKELKQAVSELSGKTPEAMWTEDLQGLETETTLFA